MPKKAKKERPIGRLAPKTGELVRMARAQLKTAQEQLSLAERVDAQAKALDAARIFIKLEAAAE